MLKGKKRLLALKRYIKLFSFSYYLIKIVKASGYNLAYTIIVFVLFII